MKNVEVGMFRLPGIAIRNVVMTEELVTEMETWAKENNCGTLMGPGLWSFRNEGQREWFVLRWSDHIPKQEKEEE